MSDTSPGFQASARIWLQLVEAEWLHAQEEHRLLEKLRLPSFVLSAQMTQTLGRWDPRARTITLSEALLEGRRWHLLVSTLRHEMAHQLVSELWQEPPEAAHGAAFARACALLGISPEARATLDELRERREEPRIVRRIRGLFALSGSPNRHEAEAALARAQELALKHHVALSQGPQEELRYIYRLLDRPQKRWPRYTWIILQTCEELHHVRYIRWSTEGGDSVIELTGTEEDLDLAEYTYHYLLHSGELAWQRYREERRLRNNRARLTFLHALFLAFDKKLARKREEIVMTQALSCAPDPKLEAAFRARYPHIRRTRAASFQRDPDAVFAGARAGASLQIKPGLNKGAGGEGARRRGLLGPRR